MRALESWSFPDRLYRSRLAHRGAAVALALALGAPAPVLAQGASAKSEGTLTQFGVGTTCALINLVYGPSKIVYALIGSVTAGLAFVLTGGRQDSAQGILYPSVRGDYVVAPAHLRGEEPLRFSGLPPSDASY